MKKLIAVLLILFLLVGCIEGDISDKPDKENDTTQNDDNKDGDKEAPEKEKEEKKIYGLGEVLTYSEDGEDLYTFVVNSVKLTDERNSFSEKEVEQVIVINYTYENLNDPEDVYIFSSHFSVIDQDGNVAETYPAGAEVSPQQAPTGAKSHGEESYGLIHESEKIRFFFNPTMFGNTKAEFELPIE